MSFGEAVRSVLGQYAGFSGRARRSEFWYWYLLLVIAAAVVGVVGVASLSAAEVLAVVLLLATALPSLAVAVRRLHDIGSSGWWVLIAPIPFGGIVLLVFYLRESDPGPNQYGAAPEELSPA